MSTVQLILYLAAALCTLSWLLYLLRAAYHGASIKLLRSEHIAPLATPPKISIIIAARNEEALLDHSLRSILETKYSNVELIAVNDRSTDATGSILDRLSAEDSRIKAIHVTELPEGWLGKVHALHTGTQHAKGDWLLFTDADIHFAPEVLSKAIAYAEAHALDQLSILPDDRTQHQGFFLPLFISAFGGLFLQRLKVKHVNEGRKGAFIGVGAFNLIRRSAFERTPGFEWLRMEVIDDVGVGYMISQIGGRIAVLHGEKLLSFEWYPSLGGAIKGLEKNAFAGFARYNVARGLWVGLSMAAVVLLPFIVTVAYRDVAAFAVVLSIYSIIPAIGVVIIGKAVNIRPILAATLPLGYLFVAIAVLNSTLKGWKDHGLRWRDTFYSLEALRKGKRVQI